LDTGNPSFAENGDIVQVSGESRLGLDFSKKRCEIQAGLAMVGAASSCAGIVTSRRSCRCGRLTARGPRRIVGIPHHTNAWSPGCACRL